MWDNFSFERDLNVINIIFHCHFKKRFYLFIHERHRERQKHRQREKQAPHREPDTGLDPRTPGSSRGPKAGAKPLSHPGISYLMEY